MADTYTAICLRCGYESDCINDSNGKPVCLECSEAVNKIDKTKAEIDRLTAKNKRSVEQWFSEILESYKDDFDFQNKGLIFELTKQVSLLTTRAEKAEAKLKEIKRIVHDVDCYFEED